MEVGDYGLLPTLYTYLSLSTVYRKFIDANTDLYKTPYPPSNLKPLLLLHPPLTPPTSFQTPYEDPLRRPPTLLRTTTDPLTAFTDPTRPLPPATHHTTLHSMADISKQVSEGQKKWSQGVDLTSIDNVNDYIKFKILEYRHYNFINNDIWEQYKEDFADFTEAVFKACKLIALYNLQTLLHN